MDVAEIIAELKRIATPERAKSAARFFKTGPGEYGESDTFIGITVPALRKLSRDYRALPLPDLETLLHAPIHEARHLALIILAFQAAKQDEGTRKAVYDLYRRNTAFVNNWDLVDCSAPTIVGGYLIDKPRTPLFEWVKSRSLWERRIALVATQYFIRNGDLADTFELCGMMLKDDEDLIHKAAGWMLREAGDNSKDLLTAFLNDHAAVMPRTMLRYAIEKFPPSERQHYLGLKQSC